MSEPMIEAMRETTEKNPTRLNVGENVDANSLSVANIRKRLAGTQGKAYWQSLDELADTDEFRAFMDQEFPREAAPLESSLDRRDFLKLLGASMAMAGLTSCVRPVKPNEKIVPYVQAPEEIIPGKPLFYATAVTQGGYAFGLLAESHMGRPTKVEGNPDHPASLGATDAVTQATVLSLYDPDRSQSALDNGLNIGWDDLAGALSSRLQGDGAGFRILTETVTSPTLAQQLGALLEQYPGAEWHQYDPLHADSVLDGAQLAFGQPVQTIYDFTKADVIVSLGADFIGRGAGKLRYQRDFSRRRRALQAEDGMNRLYLVETTPSVTSMVSDHRLPLAPAQIEAFARTVASELGVAGVETPEGDFEEGFLAAVVADLQASRGRSVVVAGEEESVVVHAVAHALNAALGNVGQTVFYTEPVEVSPVNHFQSLSELVADVNAGNVETLLILGGNPVYTAPADLDFAAALQRVPTSLHLSEHFDETSALASQHVPKTHYLETWSDARAFDGTVTIMQPLISPFYGGKSEHEMVAAALGQADASGYDLVRNYWQGRVEGDFDGFWRQTVYSGVVAGSAAAPVNVTPAVLELPAAPTAPTGLQLAFRLDPSVLDGRYANNGWLQELPKPLTKITWDNAAFIGPATAEALNVTNNDLVSLRVGEREVQAPVWVLPGQAAGVVTVHLGFGRELAGSVGSNVGFDAYRLRTSENPWFANVEVAKVPGRHKLVTTQQYFLYDGTTERRHLIRHGTLAEFAEHPEHPEFVHPVEHAESDLYPNFEYDTYAWGMVIDMNVCTGGNACVTACQAENNIPIVGKDQVEVGRAMHWIRVDTYYGGDLDNPEYYLQPVACMHCEKAPCEPVCPFGATLHDSEGLNVMVYNRCGGTRYCSNNCPYKVRRFNYLQYAELESRATELSLAMNPDVTVRSRGVMEKCTYCTQRIQQAYIVSENENRRIRDGEIYTACQAACPSEAIVFGDIGDKNSLVTRFKASPLNFSLLSELNTVPRTTYLAKLNNPNPALAAEEGAI
ncbi:TAT-variant-translocated molybdopterin oxidoreductase [soil metagenome]